MAVARDMVSPRQMSRRCRRSGERRTGMGWARRIGLAGGLRMVAGSATVASFTAWSYGLDY